tara:strand:- start:55560 stop:57167 length:1608 start_codon:yes stop_codon:yes gene_type:complete
MTNIGPFISPYGLEKIGLTSTSMVYWNLPTSDLYDEAIKNEEAVITEGGSLLAMTGEHTGRSPKDKFIVSDSITKHEVFWGDVNKPFKSDDFELIYRDMLEYLQHRSLYIQDCFAGADPNHRLSIRVISEYAWHNLFARNLFITPSLEELKKHVPEFTIIQAPGFKTNVNKHGTNSETCILVDFSKRLVLIGGTSYAGECKKSIFSILNFLLPQQDVLPMHCSVNVGSSGEAAVFFGLSGTGKTTLSADPTRTLIGDDEHGWSPNGLFNFEGGCYAKVIRLSAQAEPEIFATTSMFGTILENVVMDSKTRELNLDDATHTENTRAAYPLSFIPNASNEGISGHPKNIIMLTADAFGVLPPIARLTPSQAIYHFLSGYTAKVAGTEKGLGSEPQATFSTCFGAPFMPRHPSVYAEMLLRRIKETDANCWLVNTGWTGGAYGVGERMAIGNTRSLLRSALDGTLNNIDMKNDNLFNLSIPTSCPGVHSSVLDPRETWNDKEAYDIQARDLVERFHKNFTQFKDHVGEHVLHAAPKVA